MSWTLSLVLCSCLCNHGGGARSVGVGGHFALQLPPSKPVSITCFSPHESTETSVLSYALVVLKTTQVGHCLYLLWITFSPHNELLAVYCSTLSFSYGGVSGSRVPTHSFTHNRVFQTSDILTYCFPLKQDHHMTDDRANLEKFKVSMKLLCIHTTWSSTFLKTLNAMTIINFFLFWVAQNFISKTDFLKLNSKQKINLSKSSKQLLGKSKLTMYLDFMV